MTVDTTSYGVDADCQYYVIDGSTVQTLGASGVAGAVKAFTNTPVTSVWAVFNADGYMTALYVLGD